MKKMDILAFIAMSGALATGLGAFGAHAIKPKISQEMYSNYQTGVLYHFIHTLLMLGVYILEKHYGQSLWLKRSLITSGLGILLFSGSLYLLSTREITHWNFATFLGPITPIGGMCFVFAWLMLILHLKAAHKV